MYRRARIIMNRFVFASFFCLLAFSAKAATVSGLPAASSVNSTDLFYCDQSLTDRKCTGAQIQTFVNTFPTVVAGTVNSGGIPYFSSTTAMSSSAALGANLPVIGGGAGSAPSVGTRSGNTTTFATTTGSFTTNDCIKVDASGNLVDSGGACGGGGGTTVPWTSATTATATTSGTSTFPTLTANVPAWVITAPWNVAGAPGMAGALTVNATGTAGVGFTTDSSHIADFQLNGTTNSFIRADGYFGSSDGSLFGQNLIVLGPGAFYLSNGGNSILNLYSAAQTFLTQISIPANNTFQLGSTDAASPSAQTLKVQSVVAGTTNTPGTDFTIAGS